MKSIDNRLSAIEERNKRVELDKAWEISWTRRLSIAALTYIVITTYLFVIGNDKPLTNALVPVVGFLLSTLVLKSIKTNWQNKK